MNQIKKDNLAESAHLHYPRSFSLQRHFDEILKSVALLPWQVLQHANLPRNLFERHALATSEQYVAFLSVLIEVAPSFEELFESAMYSARSDEHSVAQAFCANAVFREGLERVCAVKPFESPFSLGVESGESSVTLRYDCTDANIPISDMIRISQLAWLYEMMRSHVDGTLEVSAIEWAGDALPDVIARHFSAPLVPSAQTGLVLPNELLKLPILPLKSKTELAPKSMREAVVLSIRSSLPSGRASIEVAARELGMSKRNLQRRLREQGVVYSELLIETRMEILEDYLTNDKLTMQEISFLLGYSEPSALYRAYRNFHGRSLGRRPIKSAPLARDEFSRAARMTAQE